MAEPTVEKKTSGGPRAGPGRVVHYVLGPGEPGMRHGEVRPAIVTSLEKVTLEEEDDKGKKQKRTVERPNLFVLLDGDNDQESSGAKPTLWRRGVEQTTAEEKAEGRWFWPPRD